MRYLLTLLLLVTPSWGADVKLADRVKNRDRGYGGYCGWCCLEMAGLSQGHEHFRGLTDRRTRETPYGACNVRQLAARAKVLGVVCEYQNSGDRDPRIIRDALRDDRPVIIGMTGWPAYGSSHAVLLIGKEPDGRYRFVDPNKPATDFLAGEDWFAYWDGFALVLGPAAQKPPPPAEGANLLVDRKKS